MTTPQPHAAPADEPKGTPKAQLPKKGPLSGLATALVLTFAGAANAACSRPPAPVCLTAEKANEDSVKGEILYKEYTLVADNVLRIPFIVSAESVTDATCQLPYTIQAFGMVGGKQVPIGDAIEATQAGKSFIDVNPIVNGELVSSYRLLFRNTHNDKFHWSLPAVFRGTKGGSGGTTPTAEEQP